MSDHFQTSYCNYEIMNVCSTPQPLYTLSKTCIILYEVITVKQLLHGSAVYITQKSWWNLFEDKHWNLLKYLDNTFEPNNKKGRILKQMSTFLFLTIFSMMLAACIFDYTPQIKGKPVHIYRILHWLNKLTRYMHCVYLIMAVCISH